MAAKGYFRIGTILKTKGLKGELDVYVDFDGLNDISFTAVFVELNGRLVPHFVHGIKYQPKNIARLQLEDVDTIEKAALLVKKDLYLPDALKPVKRADDFTLNDLEGFTVVDVDEGELGMITAIHEYPQQMVAQLTYQNCEVLFPLNEEIIVAIDIVKEILTVDLPEGLLDIYLE